MSHFYASMKSSLSKNERTLRGGRLTGLVAHLRSHKIGVHVELIHFANHDIIKIYETGGTSDATKKRLIDTIKIKNLERTR